ncbi:MAG TPA: phosphotransferase [Crinalium sp.]|jgi:hypothetical protein
MAFLLSSQTVTDYLVSHHLCAVDEIDQSKIELKVAKNFNLLLSLSDGRQLLVKQERYSSGGKTAGEFEYEWRIQELIQHFPELNFLHSSLPEILYFNADDSILVFNYLIDYRDLADFYAKDMVFSTAIATTLGTILSTIHSTTFNQKSYYDFLTESATSSTIESPQLLHGLSRVTPEIFGSVPADGLKFFALYQRYDSLGQAIAQLTDAFHPCCLVHNDLKLNNVLLHTNWEHLASDPASVHSGIVRLIDWERSRWGDPACDLGTLVASYLQLWLSSLVVSKTMSIEDSLKLAMIPLEQLQPSIAALVSAYLEHFPAIAQHRPDFLHRVVQFAGLALIQQIQAMIQHQKSFGNAGICMLQVAKSLLCRPTQSLSTIVGVSESELMAAHR